MLGWVVLCLLTFRFYSVSGQGECTDLRGRLISHGLHYVPGPDTCTLCVCDNGSPKVCKAVLCSPPQDCRSFRVGNTCCDFICLDDVVKPAEGGEANVRVAAGGAAAVVLLTVALVVYRVRRQKRRHAPHADDQRSLTSIGYISGSMGYMGGTCETAMAAWKPPGNYLPRGEAPPPYDEVVAQCRPEALSRPSEAPYHRTYPATLDALTRPDDPIQCSGHGYANIPRPIQQMANPQGCYNAPLLQPVHPPEPRDVNPMQHHPLAPNMIGYPGVRLTGSLGAIAGRALSVAPDRHAFYAPAPQQMHSALHRTIPRISTAVDTSVLESCMSGFARADRSLGGEIRRSFHKPSEQRHLTDTGRSMPRNLNIVSARDPTRDGSNIRISASGVNAGTNTSANTGTGTGTGAVAGTGACTGAASGPSGGCAAQQLDPRKAAKGGDAPQTLPLTVDKPSCVCSYEGSASGAAGAEEADDYRNECENCKAASNSRWVVPEPWRAEEEEGTQTLQRRAPPAPPPPPATATLPQPVTKQPRTIMGPPSNWENWFNSIPDSDSESEEE